MVPLSSLLAGGSVGGAMTIGKPRPASIHYHASLGVDGGAISMLRSNFPCLSTHRSIEELGDCLVRAFEQEPGNHSAFHASSMILGHGSPGSFEVGDGQYGRSYFGTIGMDNADVWEPQFARLRTPHKIEHHPYWGEIPRYRGISILSCSTAKGAEGRALIQRIADAGNLCVHAHTGLLFVNSKYYFLEKGARTVCRVPTGGDWNARGYRTCQDSGDDALSETDWLDAFRVPFTSMKLLGLGEGAEADEVINVVLTTSAQQEPREFPGEVAADLYRYLFASPPYLKDGELVAAVTANCIVRFKGRPDLHVSVLADRVAFVQPNKMFLVDPRLANYLVELVLA